MAAVVTVWTLLSTVAAADKPNAVTFKLHREYVIVVHGSIDGITNLNFIVDTGAVPSVLDKRLAGRLHLANDLSISLFTERGTPPGSRSGRSLGRHVARLPW
jgi:hypothetical protein